MSQTTSSTSITQVGRVMVPVSDRDAAIAFYVDKLGCELRSDVAYETPEGPDRWIEVAFPGSATAIAFVPPRGDVTTGRNLCVALETTDIDGDHASLRERGVDVDPEVMRMGGAVPPMFWFRDQDANILLLVQSEGS